MRKILLSFCLTCVISGVLSQIGRRTNPNAATCLEKLRTEVEADVTRIVAVLLAKNMENIAEKAQIAVKVVVEKERISQGEGIVEPAAAAVDASVANSFENLSWEVRSSIKVFITTALKRLCALENCCFTGNY